MRRPGRPPAPRRRFNPDLKDRAIDATHHGRPSWLLAALCGFPGPTDFSEILHARRVVATPLITERLQRLAAILDFPPDQVFLPEPQEKP